MLSKKEKRKPKTDSKQNRKNRITNAAIVLVFLAGLAILLYPTVSDWVNSQTATRAVVEYQDAVESTDSDKLEKFFHQADLYNRSLTGIAAGEPVFEYENQLKMDETSVMGTLSIPSIDVNLPIYHGTNEDALLKGIGHLEGSSLPVGGPGTHTVLTGHRGMPSAVLLSRLDEMEEGDIFVVQVLGRTMTYQVDSIHVVVPEDIHNLNIEKDKDLTTLVTCTPYGVNTHRLLVRGHRVSNDLDLSQLTGEAKPVDRRAVALWIGCPILLIICLVWYLAGKKKGKGIDYEEVDTEDF